MYYRFKALLAERAFSFNLVNTQLLLYRYCIETYLKDFVLMYLETMCLSNIQNKDWEKNKDF